MNRTKAGYVKVKASCVAYVCMGKGGGGAGVQLGSEAHCILGRAYEILP